MGNEQRAAAGSAEDALVARAGTCAALLGAAVVHATVVREHYLEWPPAGLFFVALQVVEGMLAVAVVLAWGRRTAVLVLASSLGTLAVWAVSRTVGLPVGPPDVAAREPVGVPDLACVVLEIAAALLVLPWVLRRRATAPPGTARPGIRSSRRVAAVAVLLAAAVTGWGLTPAVADDGEHDHDHPHESAASRVGDAGSVPQPQKTRSTT
jgi:glucose dehydrogenase